MNLSFYIFSLLKERGGAVEITGFGVFLLQKIHAKVDEKSSKILPPREIISFQKKEGELDGTQLIEFISGKTGEDLQLTKSRVEGEVERWNKELFANGNLYLEFLGNIELLNAEVVFTQQEDISGAIEYFGFEEISLKETKEGTNRESALKKVFFWLFLLIVPILVLVFIYIHNKELLLGGALFDRGSGEAETEILAPTIKKDTIPYSDSLSVDTLKVTSSIK